MAKIRSVLQFRVLSVALFLNRPTKKRSDILRQRRQRRFLIRRDDGESTVRGNHPSNNCVHPVDCSIYKFIFFRIFASICPSVNGAKKDGNAQTAMALYMNVVPCWKNDRQRIRKRSKRGG